MMRILETALYLSKIAGARKGLRYLRGVVRSSLAAYLDELSALCLLYRSKLLK